MNLKKAANKIFVDEPSRRGAVQCSIRGKNSLEKGVKLHFSAKKRVKMSSGISLPPPQQNF
jgi:hypothetical protein